MCDFAHQPKDDRSLASLLCDEELLVSSPPAACLCCPSHPKTSLDADHAPFYTTREDRDRAFALCLEKEVLCVPDEGYVEYLLSSDLLGSRFRAVRWIIKTRYRLNLSFGSVFDAVNYLDRFISANRGKKWKIWMIELLSISCLSIAAKSNDVSVPPLIEFQMEDLDHSFQSRTIQQMEVTVMKALGWRLHCVTAYSYVDLLTWHQNSLHADLTSRVTELLVGALAEPKLMEFRACVIVTAALRRSAEEIIPSKAASLISDVVSLLPLHVMEEMDRCHKAIEERVVDASGPCYCPSSPVTVLLVETSERFSCSNTEKRVLAER